MIGLVLEVILSKLIITVVLLTHLGSEVEPEIVSSILSRANFRSENLFLRDSFLCGLSMVHDCFPLVKALEVKFPALLCAFVFFKEFA
jgi:hypothetical protein